MRIGGSLFLIALGAILKWAVTTTVSGIDLQTVGLILMVVGLIALAVTIYWMTARRRTDVVYRNTQPPTYVDPYRPVQQPGPYVQRTTTYDDPPYYGP
jgi:hypothetical protein